MCNLYYIFLDIIKEVILLCANQYAADLNHLVRFIMTQTIILIFVWTVLMISETILIIPEFCFTCFNER